MATTAKKGATRKRREKKNIEKGAVHIQSTFNNTIVTITDVQGNAVSWASAGEMGFGGLGNVYNRIWRYSNYGKIYRCGL